jgi:hypothetical protein
MRIARKAALTVLRAITKMVARFSCVSTSSGEGGASSAKNRFLLQAGATP